MNKMAGVRVVVVKTTWKIIRRVLSHLECSGRQRIAVQSSMQNGHCPDVSGSIEGLAPQTIDTFQVKMGALYDKHLQEFMTMYGKHRQEAERTMRELSMDAEEQAEAEREHRRVAEDMLKIVCANEPVPVATSHATLKQMASDLKFVYKHGGVETLGKILTQETQRVRADYHRFVLINNNVKAGDLVLVQWHGPIPFYSAAIVSGSPCPSHPTALNVRLAATDQDGGALPFPLHSYDNITTITPESIISSYTQIIDPANMVLLKSDSDVGGTQGEEYDTFARRVTDDTWHALRNRFKHADAIENLRPLRRLRHTRSEEDAMAAENGPSKRASHSPIVVVVDAEDEQSYQPE
jgi:hypothetical protein